MNKGRQAEQTMASVSIRVVRHTGLCGLFPTHTKGHREAGDCVEAHRECLPHQLMQIKGPPTQAPFHQEPRKALSPLQGTPRYMNIYVT